MCRHFVAAACLVSVWLRIVSAVPGTALFVTGDDYAGIPAVPMGPDFTIEAWLFMTEANTEVFGEVRLVRVLPAC